MWNDIIDMPINVYCKVFVPMARSKRRGVIVSNVKKNSKGEFIGLDYYKDEEPPSHFWSEEALQTGG